MRRSVPFDHIPGEIALSHIRHSLVSLLLAGVVASFGEVAAADTREQPVSLPSERLDARPPSPRPVPPLGDCAIEGTIADASTGRPLFGVAVTLRTSWSEVCGEARTDPAGRYAFRRIADGSYFVKIEPPSAYPVRTMEQYKEGRVSDHGTLRIDWAIPPGLTVRGMAVFDDGRPAAGVPIAFGVGDGTLGETSTDGNGRFEFAGVPQHNRLLFWIRYDGYMVARGQEWEVDTENKNGLVVNLCRTGSISGYVVAPGGRPMPGAQVEWTRRTRSENATGGATADENGLFTLAHLPEGAYELKVSPAEGDSSPAQRMYTVELAPGEHITNVPLTYNPAMGLAIAGRITDMEGNALNGARLYWATRDGGFQEWITAGESGDFELSVLESGTYYLANVEHRGNTYYPGEIKGHRQTAGTADAVIHVEVEPPRDVESRFSGVVADSETGLPISQFEYHLARGVSNLLVDHDYTNAGMLEQKGGMESVADSSGRFSIPYYGDGPYTIAMRAPGYALRLQLIDLPAEEIKVVLDPEAFIAGYAVDAEGEPIEGAFVMYHSIHGDRLPDPSEPAALARTDANGFFRIGGLPEGEAPIMFVHPDFANTRVIAHPTREEPPVEIHVLPRGGVVTGTVYVDGEPYAEAFVDWWDPETNPGFGIGGLIDESGKYRVDRLDAGDGELIARIHADGRSRSAKQAVFMTIGAGDSITHDFHFSSTELTP